MCSDVHLMPAIHPVRPKRVPRRPATAKIAKNDAPGDLVLHRLDALEALLLQVLSRFGLCLCHPALEPFNLGHEFLVLILRYLQLSGTLCPDALELLLQRLALDHER